MVAVHYALTVTILVYSGRKLACPHALKATQDCCTKPPTSAARHLQVSGSVVRAMLAGDRQAAAAVAEELNTMRGQCLDVDEQDAAAFLRVLQVSSQLGTAALMCGNICVLPSINDQGTTI